MKHGGTGGNTPVHHGHHGGFDEGTASVSTSSPDQTASKQVMTIAFKLDQKDLLLEVPLHRNRNFITFHYSVILEHGGTPIHVRKLFEVQKRRLSQLVT